MNQLLLLEDDESLIEGLTYTLEKNGFCPRVARRVKEAWKILETDEKFDLLLLDVTLPDGTGFDLCDQLRRRGDTTPIIFLTAADEETSIIRGLDGGGDDYITKPFKLGELCSRIRALLRRSGNGQTFCKILSSREITVDLEDCRAMKNGQDLELTAAEYWLLCLFLRNAGRVLSRERILDALWDGKGSFVDDNTLSVYIRRLREKIEKNPSSPEYLITVRGFGYQWREADL